MKDIIKQAGKEIDATIKKAMAIKNPNEYRLCISCQNADKEKLICEKTKKRIAIDQLAGKCNFYKRIIGWCQ